MIFRFKAGDRPTGILGVENWEMQMEGPLEHGKDNSQRRNASQVFCMEGSLSAPLGGIREVKGWKYSGYTAAEGTDQQALLEGVSRCVWSLCWNKPLYGLRRDIKGRFHPVQEVSAETLGGGSNGTTLAWPSTYPFCRFPFQSQAGTH